MIKLHLEKIYNCARNMEPMWIGFPLKKGRLKEVSGIKVADGRSCLPCQSKVTSRYEDGSVRFAFTRFMGNLPANVAKDFSLYLDDGDVNESGLSLKECTEPEIRLSTVHEKDGFTVDTGCLKFTLKNYSEHIFDNLGHNGTIYSAEQFVGPVLRDGLGSEYEVSIDKWRVVEEGPVCTILAVEGCNSAGSGGCEEGGHYKFELRITAFAGKPWLDISYRLFNTSEAPLTVKSLVFAIKSDKGAAFDISLKDMDDSSMIDSTGCGDINLKLDEKSGPVYRTRGTKDLENIERLAPPDTVRTCAASSNYRTDFLIGRDGAEVNKAAYDKALLMEGNEHMSEVFYGTFFADRTDSRGGVCATIYQAQQNYPKAVKADEDGLYVMLVPEGFNKVVMQPGMAREQRFMLHFHDKEESLAELDSRSLIYQMPDRPVIEPEVYRQSGAVTDVFADRMSPDIEMLLIGKGDARARSFGMLNWGDTIDWNYTKQGRGGGAPVWSNNEYDFPHACGLMYMRSGIRRYMDFCMVHASHWMDVDVCHYSSDWLMLGGQIEHTKGHVMNGVLVPSHQWVEGLLDYYHFTGDERGLETAVGIGENVLRLLETPEYSKAGESNARETGWALRTLTALYIETADARWKEKCDSIVGYFEGWYEEYGSFEAPYTDNTLIRVGFMISVAVGSLMRYYRIEPSDKLKKLIMLAVDDLVDNCRLECGLFYYKELPSLSRLGNNALLLEAMATGYELTGNTKYLEAGMGTLKRILREPGKHVGGDKQIIGDAMVWSGESTKNFAQSFYPIAYFYKCIVEADMDGFLR